MFIYLVMEQENGLHSLQAFSALRFVIFIVRQWYQIQHTTTMDVGQRLTFLRPPTPLRIDFTMSFTYRIMCPFTH